MNTRPNRKKRAGFTLIEIMVVVLIVGLLIGTVGPNVWNALFSSQAKIAANQITQLEEACDLYKAEFFKFPDSLDQLTEPLPTTGEAIMEVIPLDPWKNEFEYELTPDRKVLITSYGGDSAPGGEGPDADITSETIRER